MPARAQDGEPADGWREDVLTEAAGLSRLHGLIVARNGEELIAERFAGPSLSQPVNIKSAAKSVISALVGRAIAEGLIAGVDARVADLLPDALPEDPDPLLLELTVGNLLSMQAGLERTSGPNYGRWVVSDNWVRHALSRPFVDRPGGRMLYSTGNSHILSAILTKVSGRSTLALAREWLGAPLEIAIPAWQQDPQGIYFGGNNMALSPRALLQFGELYRNGGRDNGQQVLPQSWIETSWMPRTRSPFSGDQYGYGWFITRACGAPLYYARGFGGQYVYVLPAAGVTVVVTSDATEPTRGDRYGVALEQFIFRVVLPGLMGEETAC